MKYSLATLVVCYSLLAVRGDDCSEEGLAALGASSDAFSRAFASKDSDKALLIYGTDAALMPPGEKVMKQSQIPALWDMLYGYGAATLAMSADDVRCFGEYIAERGTYVMNDDNGDPWDQGKYVTLWQKKREGLRVIYDIFNN